MFEISGKYRLDSRLWYYCRIMIYSRTKPNLENSSNVCNDQAFFDRFVQDLQVHMDENVCIVYSVFGMEKWDFGQAG